VKRKEVKGKASKDLLDGFSRIGPEELRKI
jgi:hypothetical protein